MPVRGLAEIAPNRQTMAHMKHPWHRSSLTKTRPRAVSLAMAPLGQAATQGASAQ